MSMEITVDEGAVFLKTMRFGKECEKELPYFRKITNRFRLWFYFAMLVRGFALSTVIMALFQNNSDFIEVWTSGYGILGVLGYMFCLCITRLTDPILFIAVIVAAFNIGDGFGANFVTYLLPVVLIYACGFSLVFASNCAYSYLITTKCPKIWGEINSEIMMRKMMNGINPFA